MQYLFQNSVGKLVHLFSIWSFQNTSGATVASLFWSIRRPSTSQIPSKPFSCLWWRLSVIIFFQATFTHVIQTIPEMSKLTTLSYEVFSLEMPSNSIHHTTFFMKKNGKTTVKRLSTKALWKSPLLSIVSSHYHLKELFVFEFLFVTNELIVFFLRCIMRDGRDMTDSLVNSAFKFYQRTRAVIPKADDKMAVVNNQLTLTSISNERMKRYNKMIKKALETVGVFVFDFIQRKFINFFFTCVTWLFCHLLIFEVLLF